MRPTADSTLDEKELAAATTFFKALSDPNRLRIFAALMNGDSCNCELQEALGLAPSLLSHHLRALEKAGLVSSRKDLPDGRWIYYSVNSAAVGHWRQMLAAFLDSGNIKSGTLCGPEGQLVRQESGPTCG